MKPLTKNLIAPCGMNCALCLAYQREKNKCPGCRFVNDTHQVTRSRCRIKRCDFFIVSKSRFCFDCSKYPCARLRHLDKRYSTNYGMSMIENLNNIKRNGIRKFIKEEKIKWACRECGNIICVHRDHCLSCGTLVIKTTYQE
jgi:hypothetical protein